MAFPVVAAIGAALGLLKGAKDKEKARKDMLLQAELQRYSPWTGMGADLSQVQQADPMGSAVQGGFAGFTIDQQMNANSGGGSAMGGAGEASGLRNPTTVEMLAQNQDNQRRPRSPWDSMNLYGG